MILKRQVHPLIFHCMTYGFQWFFIENKHDFQGFLYVFIEQNMVSIGFQWFLEKWFKQTFEKQYSDLSWKFAYFSVSAINMVSTET